MLHNNIKAVCRDVELVNLFLHCAFHENTAFHKVVPVKDYYPSLCNIMKLMPGPSAPLYCPCNAFWASKQDYKVNEANVNPQLQTGRGNNNLQLSFPQGIFNPVPVLLGQGAMMRANILRIIFWEFFLEMVHNPFCCAPCVCENKGCFVLLNKSIY